VGMLAVLQQMDADDIPEMLGDPKKVVAAIQHYAEEDRVDLDKAWHGIHFLLTGTAWGGTPPLSYLVVGGENVCPVDMGYGPVRLLRPPEVRAFAKALAGLDEGTLRSRFDPARMRELDIYPEIWDRPDELEDSLAYLLDNFAMLRDFVGRASEAGRALLINIS